MDETKHGEVTGGEIPVGVAFGRALVASLTGPCAGDMHCPIRPGEVYRRGMCMLDGCPRRVICGSGD